MRSRTAPGGYRLLACADDMRRVRKRNERNNCRAANSASLHIGGASSSSAGSTHLSIHADFAGFGTKSGVASSGVLAST